MVRNTQVTPVWKNIALFLNIKDIRKGGKRKYLDGKMGYEIGKTGHDAPRHFILRKCNICGNSKWLE